MSQLLQSCRWLHRSQLVFPILFHLWWCLVLINLCQGFAWIITSVAQAWMTGNPGFLWRCLSRCFWRCWCHLWGLISFFFHRDCCRIRWKSIEGFCCPAAHLCSVFRSPWRSSQLSVVSLAPNYELLPHPSDVCFLLVDQFSLVLLCSAEQRFSQEVRQICSCNPSATRHHPCGRHPNC